MPTSSGAAKAGGKGARGKGGRQAATAVAAAAAAAAAGGSGKAGGFAATAVSSVGFSDRRTGKLVAPLSPVGAAVRVVRESPAAHFYARPTTAQAERLVATALPSSGAPRAARALLKDDEEDEVLDALNAPPATRAQGEEDTESAASDSEGDEVDEPTSGRAVPPSGGVGHLDKFVLESQFTEMSELADAVAESVARLARVLENEERSGTAGMSAATRRVVVKKSVSQLKYSSMQLDSLRRAFGLASAEALRMRKACRDAKRAKKQIADRLYVLMRQLESEGGTREKQLEVAKRCAIVERDLAHAVQGQARTAARADALQSEMDAMIAAKRHAEERMSVAEDVAASASDAAAAAKAGRSAIEARADKAEADLARAREVVAKLTADNLVLMMRAETNSKSLKIVEAERDTLKAALAKEHDAWLENARTEVEAAVRDAMSAADAATDAAEVASAGARDAAKAASERAEKAEAERDASAAELSLLREQLRENTSKLEFAEAEHASSTESLREVQEQLHEMTTEQRLLKQSLSQARNEVRLALPPSELALTVQCAAMQRACARARAQVC